MSWIMIPALLLVAAYLLFVCGLLRVVFGRTPAPAEKKRPQKSPAVSESLLSVDVSDDDFAVLWCTQVPILRLLNSAGHTGLATASIVPIYQDLARHYPELCDGKPFSDWLQRLQQAEVIVRRDDTIEITDKGIFVLDCVENRLAHPASAPR